jgi:hypothetical protein
MRAAAATTLLTVAVLVPGTASAQEGAIVGRVLDTAGDVLPGVTVEVVGPAQVEPRLEVTDLEGRYRIDDLPSGNYTVYFMLPGFGSVVRHDVDVGADLVTTVDAEMSVGAIDGFVVVSPSSPSPGGAAALKCTFLPSGAIVDCRRVTVAGSLQGR